MEVYTAVTFTVGFAACLGLLYWAQRLLRRYSAARDAADLSVRQLNDELRQQVEQKNELNAELQRSVAEIHRLNADLERLVDERTAELQATNAQLLRSNEDLTRFAYVASHDLQEPLRIIGSYAGLLAKRYHGKLDERADKYIHYVVDGAKRMQTLVQDLLAYSRAGTQALKRERISLDSVAAQAAADLRMAIADAGAVLTRDKLPVINADARKLTQVLSNLLSNAIKFRKPGEIPRVHVRAQRAGEFWTISVEDNGIGFEQEFADRIFVVFQRLHEIGAYPGTGIGLAICKRIVEAHGGRIWAESQPGAGSAFRFTIPAVDVREDVVDPEHHEIPEQQNA
jgi:light-regulated signal transduction histidine kinase (bacteriophytochrome)